MNQYYFNFFSGKRDTELGEYIIMHMNIYFNNLIKFYLQLLKVIPQN